MILADQEDPFLGRPSASILLLGTFHFQDAGRDWYKPQFDADVLSERRQREVAEVVEMLAAFRPTKIGVERTPRQQEELDQTYRAHLRDEFPLSANEVHQLGFRLARRLGHARVYGVNAWDRHYDPDVDLDAYAKEQGQEHLLSQWSPRFRQLYVAGDEQKTRETLRATLLRMNDEKSVLRSHGHYLVDYFKLGAGEEYAGPDWVTGWYNRNLRIFANLQRITEMPSERLILIIGAGHVPVLRHCVLASPEYELAEVHEYLAAGKAE